ncbi:MAG: RNA pseudouridine synthase [Treponema sp.]|nr:RNA pseudouridine synthase [Treponema sp.]
MNAFWESRDAEKRVLRECPHYLILYKPPRLHTAPLRAPDDGSLLGWAAQKYPDILAVNGHRAGEGGLLYRLDYETRGLVLIARTQKLFDALKGGFTKQYDAFSAGVENAPGGFPPFAGAIAARAGALQEFAIRSAFRAYGPGRRAVRPVPGGAPRTYVSEGVSVKTESGVMFRICIHRAFRHQIRCHLAWAGYPLLNDRLYGGRETGQGLALRASSITFRDGAELVNYALEP